ncbi:hypothetical protein BH09SUM1_BH09SUM1_29040 [soil metagenome]
MSHEVANRKATRYSCNFSGYLQVLCPELTFTPKPLYVQAHDISRTGCRLATKAITPDFYRLLLQEIRHAKLELDLQDGRVLNLRGKIVWVEYREKISMVALSVNGLKESAQNDLDLLLDEMAAKGAITAVETSRPEVSSDRNPRP